MKNFIKIFLICKMVLISFSQNSEAGFLVSKEEVDESNQDAHSLRRQPSIGAIWQGPTSADHSFESLQQNFCLFPSGPISPSFENNHDAVNPSTLNDDDDIPITGQNKVNFEEVAKQNNMIGYDKKHGEQEQKPIASNSAVQVVPQSRPKKQNALKKINYAKQIALGQQSAICLPQSPLEETIPTVEGLIQTVIQKKIEAPVKVHVPLNREELLDFHEAFRVLVSKYPFPFTWSTTNKGCSNIEGNTPFYILELSLASRANERERVEKKFVYQVSQEDEKKVNWPYVFDVAMRSGLTLKDFKFNNSIKIRMIELKGNTEAQDLQEFQQFLEQKLPKDNNPLHILSITFNSKTKGHYGEMFDVFLRKISDVNVGYRSRGIVFDSQNGLLYLCLDNSHRKMLDLHGKKLSSGEYEGRSVKDASHDTQDFIMQAYQTFKDDVIVLTGRGNHVNENGKKGVLKEAFGAWVKAEPFSPIIENYSLIEGEGGYKVIFKKVQNLNLNNLNAEDPIPFIKKTITQMAQQKKTRLLITLNSQENPPIHNKEFKLITAVYADLQANSPQLVKLITPISFESTPGKIKIIFNTQHSKGSHFTFEDSYGSTSVFGTIH